MKCVVVYNPHSGRSLPASELRKAFRAASIEIITLVPVSKDMPKKLASAIKKGHVIAAIGGDGTISSVAELVANTKAALLPLPGGTLNHFTKDLGIAQNLDAALMSARTGKPRRIDIASVNGHYFVNNSSLGLYPDSLGVRDRLEDTFGKWPSAVVGAARALVNFHSYHVTIDGRSLVTPFIFVGNNDYQLSEFGATDRTALDAGLLYVAIAKASSRWQLVKIFGRALTGRLHAMNDFDTFTITQELTIETRRKQLHVSRDGELLRLTAPIVYRVHPKKLRVIAP